MFIMLCGEQLYMQITGGKQHRRGIIVAMYTFIMSRVSEI